MRARPCAGPCARSCDWSYAVLCRRPCAAWRAVHALLRLWCAGLEEGEGRLVSGGALRCLAHHLQHEHAAERGTGSEVPRLPTGSFAPKRSRCFRESQRRPVIGPVMEGPIKGSTNMPPIPVGRALALLYYEYLAGCVTKCTLTLAVSRCTLTGAQHTLPQKRLRLSVSPAVALEPRLRLKISPALSEPALEFNGVDDAVAARDFRKRGHRR